MSQLWMDVRHAARLLGRQPVLASIVVLTLALGIGGNAAIFSVANALLLQPLPLPEPDRLVLLLGHDRDGQETYISFPDFQDLKRDAKLVEGFTAFVPQSVNLTGRPEPERVRGGFVSEEFFASTGSARCAATSACPAGTRRAAARSGSRAPG